MQQGFILTSIEARLGQPLLLFPASSIRSIHRSAMDAAIAAVWRFNVLKGGRLAALTGIAVDRAVLLWINDPANQSSSGGGRAKAAGARLDDWRTRVSPLQRWLEVDPRIIRRLDQIDPLERAVVELRYGLAETPPMTGREIAVRLGIYEKRIGALERAALAQARSGASD